MPMLSVEKALRSLRKTPIILRALLRDVDQVQAASATDGPDGWSILFVVCHLRDFEAIYGERLHLMLETDYPKFPHVDQNELPITNRYAEQNLQEVLQSFLEQRRAVIDIYEKLTDEQWARRGLHPNAGDHTVLELAINMALHDVNHIEQILHTLEPEQTAG